MRGSLIGLCLLFCAPPLLAQTSRQVPAALLVAATQEPLPFAMSLADARVPTGIELRSPYPVPPKPEFDLGRQSTVDIIEVVSAFNASHLDYRATVMDDVVVIRPTANTVPYLDAEANLEWMSVTGLMNATCKAFANLNPRFGLENRFTGSSMGLSAAEQGDFDSVALDGRGRKVIDVLNQISRQSGRGWIVETSDDSAGTRIRSFGLIYDHGTCLHVALPTVWAPTLTPTSTTATAGATISLMVAYGPGHTTDWVGLYPTAAADTEFLTRQYLNGSTTPPGVGVSGATLSFTAPMSPGTYNLRLFSGEGSTKLATSATVTVP